MNDCDIIGRNIIGKEVPERILNLYNIVHVHLRPWTEREIAFWGIITAVIVTGAVIRYKKGKICGRQAIAGVLLFLYLVLVFSSAVFTRMPDGNRQLEWRLFWSWWEVIVNHDQALLQEILLNLVFLLPMGVLLPLVADKKIAWWKGLAAGGLFSFIIESCQLVFSRGLFEWDDIVHNGLGCMAGCMICGAVFFHERRKKR